MAFISIQGMAGYPGAPGSALVATGGEYIHGIQNQAGTWTDVALNLSTIWPAMMLVWFNALPTAQPGSAGILWNNGGTLSQS